MAGYVYNSILLLLPSAQLIIIESRDREGTRVRGYVGTSLGSREVGQMPVVCLRQQEWRKLGIGPPDFRPSVAPVFYVLDYIPDSEHSRAVTCSARIVQITAKVFGAVLVLVKNIGVRLGCYCYFKKFNIVTNVANGTR